MNSRTYLLVLWLYVNIYGVLLGMTYVALWWNLSWKVILASWFASAGIVYFTWLVKKQYRQIVEQDLIALMQEQMNKKVKVNDKTK